MKLNKLLIAVSIATFALASCESEFTKDAELNVNLHRLRLPRLHSVRHL